MLSANTFAADKKDFDREQLLINSVPATKGLLNAVISKIDQKHLRGEPKIQLKTNRKALKHFCLGAGSQYPDLVATTREMNEEEFKRCQNNSISSIVKLKIGYEALVVASAKNSIDLELDQRKLYKALAKDVPKPNAKAGMLTANPYKTWKDIDDKAPKQAIKFYGPAEYSRDERSVKLLGMEGGCRTWDWVPELKYIQTSYRMYRELCNQPRKDGAYIRTDKAGTDLVKKILSDKNSIGLMGFNDWLKSKDKLKAYPIDELPPTIGTISKGLYPLSRSYYVYIKTSNLEKVQALSHVMNELVNEKTLASDGYLADMGMVAMPEREMKKEISQALEFTAMETPQAE